MDFEPARRPSEGDSTPLYRVSDLPFPDPQNDHHRLANALWLLDNNPSARALLPALEDAADTGVAGEAPAIGERGMAEAIAAGLVEEDGTRAQLAQGSNTPAAPYGPPTRYDAFFDQHYGPVNRIAAQLGVDPTLVLGVSAHESAWGTTPQALQLNNPFGRTPDGATPVRFRSIDDAWNSWARTHGARIENLGTDAQAFVDRLRLDNRAVYGPTMGGDRLGAYNSRDPYWDDLVLDAIESVQNRLPQWLRSRRTRP